MLILLITILFVWQPVTVAVEIASTLPTLGMRGLPALVELLAHGLVAAVSVAAGWSLWARNAAGPALAAATMIGAIVTGVQSLYWTVLPTNIFPSDRLVVAALTVVHCGAWLVYLRRSRRVRAIADGVVTE